MSLHHISKKHSCTLNLGSDSMLPKKEDKKQLCRSLKKLTLIALAHPKSDEHFVSYPAIVAERQRQLIEGGPGVIHPFSLFSLIWCSFMAFINVVFITLVPFRFCYVLPQQPPTNSVADHIIVALQFIILLDIIVQFNTGYKANSELYIVITRPRIACHYLIWWFPIDLASVLPLGYCIPFMDVSFRLRMFMRILPIFRCIRLTTVLTSFKTFLKLLKLSYMARRGLRLALLFVITMHWCCCVLYIAPVVYLYWTGNSPQGYTKFLMHYDEDITRAPLSVRYEKGLYISCAAFFGTGYAMFNSENPGETAIFALIILYSSIFMVYTLVLLLKTYMTLFDSSMRYHELMNQVEKYMRHRQFSLLMRNRIREFYKYRYQERYYKEDAALECLSEQLRNEIMLDTCQKLIDKVSLFEGLPPSIVGTVLGCLKPEIYMPNDLVVSAGDEGHCMYFIATGTVAVYSLKGAEVCHLEDGAHFGEVALLMKDRKRVATVVAIEITHVYRLDAHDFGEFVKTFQELYERVEMLASKRMHETVLIDEAFKHGSSF